MELRIQLFGRGRYRLGGGPWTPLHGKRAPQIIALLSLSPEHAASRREIQRQLWSATRGEQDDVRKGLAYVRRSHPDLAEYLADSAGWVRFGSPNSEELAVWVDVLEFERQSAAASYEQALALARGRLLEDVPEGESNWLNDARRRWHSEVAHAWQQLALRRWHDNRRAEAIQLAERGLQWRETDAAREVELSLLLAHDGQRRRGIERLQTLLKSQQLASAVDERRVGEAIGLLQDPARELPAVPKPLEAPSPSAASETPVTTESLRVRRPAEYVPDVTGEQFETSRPEVGSANQSGGRRRRRRVLAAAALCAVAATVATASMSIGRGSNDGDADRAGLVDAPKAHSPRPARREIIVVDNRVTRGLKMAEDAEPLRLTTKPWTYCLKRACAIRATERRSGQTYDAAICQTKGDSTTNGDLGNDSDNKNSRLHTSDRYYRVQLADDTYGYVSEVWITANGRGGLDLPSC